MDLRMHGLVNVGPVHAHLAPAQLIEMALARAEGVLAANGTNCPSGQYARGVDANGNAEGICVFTAHRRQV